MEKPEWFEIPEYRDIISNLDTASRHMAKLKLYELLDRLEELIGDIEEEALRTAAKTYK